MLTSKLLTVHQTQTHAGAK